MNLQSLLSENLGSAQMALHLLLLDQNGHAASGLPTPQVSHTNGNSQRRLAHSAAPCPTPASPTHIASAPPALPTAIAAENGENGDPAAENAPLHVLLDTSLASAPIDPAYLRHFEQKVNAIAKLDKVLTVALNAITLGREAANLETVISARNPLASNYIDRLTVEMVVHPMTDADDTFTGSTRRTLDAAARTERRRVIQEKTKDCATGELWITEPKDDADTAALAGKGLPTKKPKTKRAGTLEDVDSKRRKIDEATDETDVGSALEKTRGAKENGRLRIKLLLKDPDDKSTEAAQTPADAKLLQAKAKELRSILKQYDSTYVAIWKDLSRKDGPKAARLLQSTSQTKQINLKKTAILASRELKRWLVRNSKNQKDITTKARRAMREMSQFWKRSERQERDARKKQERELVDKAKKEEEDREARRQSRKLNFLITQTELYSHFISKKMKTSEIEGADADPALETSACEHALDQFQGVEGQTADFAALDFDSDNEDALQRAAAKNAQNALELAKTHAEAFDDNAFKNPDTNGEEMNFQNPTLVGHVSVEQPKMLRCTLKEYQIKGLNWLANLYEQGINGILADEMGLGKTVQSISVLAYLAEMHNIWGPFLVVTPASTLHNWQQEISKFVPEMKVLPYWGNTKDRKILRKFWDRKSLRYGKDAPFHVLVTSYQLAVGDVAYFQKMKWQYMILDEAQAIKSSLSTRWKSLLGLLCRNRLLLTGTPIQNSMQELWALLHFIMPSLFDSHDEFSDWFSKDIESHAQSNTQLNEQQLKRLHVILKPFMLRRVKKNVQSELGDKLEIDMFCDLTNRQKKYYLMLKLQISLVDLLSNNSSDDNSQSLMNLVMQFRKVCNHPDLFERADVASSFAFGTFAETSSFLRELDLELAYTLRNSICYNVPWLVYDELLLPSHSSNVGPRRGLLERFSIYSPENVADDHCGLFGWLAAAGTSPGDLYRLSHQNIVQRAIDLKEYTDAGYAHLSRLRYVYGDDSDAFGDAYVPPHQRLLIQELHSRRHATTSDGALAELTNVSARVYDDMYVNVLEPAAKPVAVCAPIDVCCASRAFTVQLEKELFDERVKAALRPLSKANEHELMCHGVPVPQYPKANIYPAALSKLIDYSNIRMPSMNRFITESGKLARLDKLLEELKRQDHRVLVYFQMTKMMDLMEEFLTFRQHNYIRLDGSSKLEDRRDLVHDWQTQPEIFVFLLSTRAGGLGINLTAADTVIFYDSDWNPTIDSQAMDRAHRLGQTKQVTVYRLLTKGTIEERMRDRAKQKEQVQQVVMEGKANFGKKKDDASSKKKDVAFLLLGSGDDDESAGGTPSSEPISNRLEAMYHEGEGDFSENATPAP